MTTAAFPPRGGGRRGGTASPLVVLAATLGILLSLRPWIEHRLLCHRLVESSRQISYQLHSAREAARQTGLPVIVVPDLEGRSLGLFLDRDGDLRADRGESLAGLGQTVSLELPRGVFFLGPDTEPTASGDRALDGLTPIPGSRHQVAIFEADGRVRDSGAIRIGDARPGRKNVLEIRLRRESPRIEVSKLIYGSSRPSASFVPYGLRAWEWY